MRFTSVLFTMACLGGCSEFRPAAPENITTDDAGLPSLPAATDAASVSPFEVVQGVPVGEALNAIWGASAETIFAVGTNGLHMEYRDGRWQRRGPTFAGRHFAALWGRSADEVYAVGVIEGERRGIIQHFDGNVWRDEYVADAPIYGVWGTDTMILAVGAKGMVYGKKVGTTEWAPRLSKGLPANPKVPVTDESPALWSISGQGSDNFVIAAGQNRFFHYVGGGDFVNLDPTADRTISFQHAWASPGTDTSVFLGTNHLGIGWLVSSPPATLPPQAVTLDQQLFMLQMDQSRPGSRDLSIRGIWGTKQRTIFVGDLGTIFTFDPGTNDVVPIPSPSASSLRAVWGSALDDVWIVGDRELILHGSIAHGP